MRYTDDGRYPVGTEVFWIQPPSGYSARVGSPWGTIAGYNKGVAHVETSPRCYDNDSHNYAMAGITYGTREEVAKELSEIARRLTQL